MALVATGKFCASSATAFLCPCTRNIQITHSTCSLPADLPASPPRSVLRIRRGAELPAMPGKPGSQCCRDSPTVSLIQQNHTTHCLLPNCLSSRDKKHTHMLPSNLLPEAETSLVYITCFFCLTRMMTLMSKHDPPHSSPATWAR